MMNVLTIKFLHQFQARCFLKQLGDKSIIIDD